MFQKPFNWLFICLLFTIFQSAFPQCQVCNGTCTSPYYYYDYSTFICLACPSSCLSCTDASTCTQCVEGYTLNSAKNCVPCGVEGCSSCSTAGVCTTCASGFYLQSASTCASCPSATYTDPLIGQSFDAYLCNTCTSASKCTTCLNMNIVQSIYNLTYPYTLLVSAMYIDSTGICQFCPPNCSACISATICSACVKGANFNTTSCNACPEFCDACDSTGTQCNMCSSGYYLLNGSCLTCSSNCNMCVDNSTCTSCVSAFYLNNKSGCTACIANCQTCTDAFTCKTCQSNYEYIAGSATSASQCSICPEGCTGCLTTYALSIGICAFGAEVINAILVFMLIFVSLGVLLTL